MSKVIHLSDEAHHEAKEYCKVHGLRMSDWVAELIKAALAGQGAPVSCDPQQGVASSTPSKQDLIDDADHVPMRSVPTQTCEAPAMGSTQSMSATNKAMAAMSGAGIRNVAAFVPKKKMLASYDESTQTNEDGVPPYAAPPFWAKAK